MRIRPKVMTASKPTACQSWPGSPCEHGRVAAGAGGVPTIIFLRQDKTLRDHGTRGGLSRDLGGWRGVWRPAGRPAESEVIAERVTRVLGPEAPAGLQDRNDLLGERPQLVRQGRSHDREAVDRPGVLGGDD